VLYFK